MAIPLGQLGVAAGRTLAGVGKGRLLGRQLELQAQDKDQEHLGEMLRLSLAMQTAQRGTEDRAALSDFLTSHGAADLAGLPGGAAMTEYGRRQPPRPGAAEGRLTAQAAHQRLVAQAKGELEGLVARYFATVPPEKRPAAKEFFQFLKQKFPTLPDSDIWDLVGDVKIPKKPGAGATLDLDALRGALNLQP